MAPAELRAVAPPEHSLVFSAHAAEQLWRHCEEQWPHEAIGLGFGPAVNEGTDRHRVIAIRGVRNIAPMPTDAYIAAPEEIVGALVDASQHQLALRVIFHSHPGPRGGCVCAKPSESDVVGALMGSQAAWPGVEHLVVGCAPGLTPDAQWRRAMSSFMIDAKGRPNKRPDPSWEAPGGTLKRCDAFHCS